MPEKSEFPPMPTNSMLGMPGKQPSVELNTNEQRTPKMNGRGTATTGRSPHHSNPKDELLKSIRTGKKLRRVSYYYHFIIILRIFDG